MGLEYRCSSSLLRNKQNIGIIDYKRLSKMNIDKFLEGKNSYYNSNELWSLATEIYQDKFSKEVTKISIEEKVSKQSVIQEFRRQFQYRIYEASIIEAICIWNISRSKNYNLESVSDDEDRNNKIDVKFRHKETQICINIQVKKWRKNIDIDKRTNELWTQISIYGVPALYFEINFSEKDRNKRTLYYIDNVENSVREVDFKNTYGRGKDFHDRFIELLDCIHNQQLKKNVEYYENLKINF